MAIDSRFRIGAGQPWPWGVLFFFVPASKERTLGPQITLFVPARIPRIYFTSSEIKDIYWSDATSGIRERSTEPEEKSLATECPFLLR